MDRRKFLKLMTAGLLAAGGGAAYSTLVAPFRYEIVEQRIALPRLGPGLAGLRAAQISDLHIGDWFTRGHLEQLVSLVIAQKTDLVFITGDFLTRGGDTERALVDLFDPLRALAAALPVYCILGNHDFYRNADGKLRKMLKEAGAFDVTNGMEVVTRGGDALHVAGAGSTLTGDAYLRRVSSYVPADSAAVLLAHEPDVAPYTAELGKFGLQISGHTHGGQVVLPWVGPIALPRLGQRFPAGLYRLENFQVYTNRGIGMTSLPVRVNCPPEITVFTFEPPA